MPSPALFVEKHDLGVLLDTPYKLMPIAADGRYHSEVIPGLWLQVDWLWAEPLPRAAKVLRTLNLF